MRVEVEVMETSKKKLVRNTCTGHVKKWEILNWQREQMAGKWRGNGGEEHRNCDGIALKATYKEWGRNEKTHR